MKIEIWSDYVCPFCYIGKRRLEQALEKFPHKDQVEIVFKSFELDPSAPKDSDQSTIENLAQKYGTSIEQAKQMTDNVAEQAKTVGLQFNFEVMKHTNTFDAHRLAKFAEEKGKALELNEALLHASFITTERIGNDEVLVQIAEKVGLDREEVKEVLQSTKYSEEVRQDQFEARQLQIQGVPFFVFNRKYAVSGAQPESVFLNTLEKVWEEENKQPTLQTITDENAKGASCTDAGCDIPSKES